ncbi:LPP20 family lipoprotein [Marinomonas epiphytica]
MTQLKSMQIKQCLLLGLLALGLSGCVGLGTSSDTANKATELPDWVFNPPKSSSLLYGVGSAERIENIALAFAQAEQNGNGQIAQQLQTQVSQVSTQDVQVSSQAGQDEQVNKVQTAYTHVRTAPIDLEQTKNEQRFTGEHYVYALQSLDRSRVAARLQSKLAEQDIQILNLASQLASTSDAAAYHDDWPTYMGLIPLFAQRSSYQQELNLFSTSRSLQGVPSSEVKAVETRVNEALQSIGFAVGDNKNSDTLASALAKFGLSPKENSLFTLTTNTNLNHQIQSGRYYVFEEGSLSLTGPEGEKLAAWTVSARGIGTDQIRATHQANQAWSVQAVEAMFNWLTRLN